MSNCLWVQHERKQSCFSRVGRIFFGHPLVGEEKLAVSFLKKNHSLSNGGLELTFLFSIVRGYSSLV